MQRFLDLAYASASPSQRLDLYLPAGGGEKPFPLILFAHGGAFAFGDKGDDQVAPVLEGLKRGFAVASIEYRKSGEARFPAMVYDGKAAIRFLRARAEEFGLDKSRFFAWGPSSGGWLVSMLGVTAGNPAFSDLSLGDPTESDALQGVVDWCGPCGDFLLMDSAFQKSGAGTADHDEADSPESRFLGARITGLPELCRMACPCSYVTAHTPPFLIVHGGIDQIVPVEQSQRFFAALQQAAPEGKHRLHIAPGMLHHGKASWYNEPWVAKMGFAFLESL